jgi:hypothetical protein
MKTYPALLAALASTLFGCASAESQFLPADLAADRVYTHAIEVGTIASPATLERVLPTTLARYGYFIAKTQQSTSDNMQFLTEWLETTRARTRLVVDARRRGPRYALSIYAITYWQNEAGSWQEARPSDELRTQLREVGRRLALEIR